MKLRMATLSKLFSLLSLLLVATVLLAPVSRPAGSGATGMNLVEVMEEEDPAGHPFEAEEYNFRMRVPGRAQSLPMERYRAALEHMTRMPRYSTRLGKNIDSLSMQELSSSRLASPSASAGRSLTVPLDAWEGLGPGNIGGRTRAILIDPSNPNVMYAGGVSGGVWKSLDAGARWDPISDLIANVNIGSMAMDPADSSTIYVGTGEGFFISIAFPRGNGIFKTSDGGANWTHLLSTRDNPDFHYVSKIVVSPKDRNRIYAATRTGVWRSPDAGASWSRILFPQSKSTPGEVVNAGCLDLALRTDLPTDVLLAACGMLIDQGSIYRTTDAAATTPAWSEVLTEPGMGRSSLAIAPSNQSVMYALAASIEPNQFRFGMLAFYRSTDGGATWTAQVRNTDPETFNTILLSSFGNINPLCTGAPANGFSQGPYDNIIAVDPADPNRVWAGGIFIFRSTDGGANWLQAAIPRIGNVIHVDHHAIVFHPNYNGTTNQTMWVGNDGGLYKTDNAADGTVPADPCALFGNGPLDGTLTWQSMNNHYGVTQFYHGMPFPGGAAYLGGTQDNGTPLGGDIAGFGGWQSIMGGDGGYVAVDPTNPDIVYAESQFFGFARSDAGGADFSIKLNGITEPRRNFAFITPFVMDPSDPRRLWTGGRFPWRTSDRAETWELAGPELQDDEINFPGFFNQFTALAVAPGNPDHVLAASENGFTLRTDTGLSADGASAWTVSRPRPGFISWLAFDPTDENIVYATVSTFNFTGSTGHVFKSVDGGSSWSNLDGFGSTAIPDIPVHTIAVDPADTSVLYVGTDVGVFVSRDGGSSWAVEHTGFANVKTEALTFAKIGKVPHLFAFTHGRGAFRVPTNDGPVNTAPVAVADTVKVGTGVPQDVPLTGYDPDVEALTFAIVTSPLHGTLGPVTPISATAATVPYTSDPGYAGPDSFAIRVADAEGATSDATVTLAVVEPAPAPVLESLSPASAAIGGPDFTLTANGSGFTVDSKIHWHNLATGQSAPRPTTFISATSLSTTITAFDIINADPIQVFVVTPLPGGGTSNLLDFTILAEGDNPVPSLSSLSPGYALVGDPGVDLAVFGSGFVTGSVLRWNGSDRPTSFFDDTRLNVTIPASDLTVRGPVTLTVFNPAPGGGVSNAVEFMIFNPDEVNPSPDYTAIDPNWARAGSPGATVSVFGSGFVAGTVVRWNGSARPTTMVSGTLVTAAIPAGDLAVEGQAVISVSNPPPGGGTVSKTPAGFFNILPAENRVPIVTGASPAQVVEGGANFQLIVLGAEFGPDAVARWNGADRTTTFVSPNRVVANIPAADIAAPGVFEVTVFNPAPGGGTSNAVTVEVLSIAPFPVLDSVEPLTVTALSGAQDLILRGSGFVDRSLVDVGALPRMPTFVSDTELHLTTSFFNGGSVPIKVRNTPPGGGSSNIINLNVENPVPVAESLSPSSIAAGSAGFELKVIGQTFNNSSIVRWNGVDLPTENRGSSGELFATVPAANLATPGSAQVTVFNGTPGGGTSGPLTFPITDFSLNAVTTNANVRAGETANYQLSIAGQGGAFDSEVSLGCSGLPALTTCSFSPPAVVPGTAGATTTLSIQTTGKRGFVLPDAPRRFPPVAPRVVLILGMVAMLLWAANRTGSSARALRRWSAVAVLAVAVSALTACGGGKANRTPPGTHTITITGQSGALTHSVTVSLTVTK